MISTIYWESGRMEWLLKLPSNADGGTDFSDKLALDGYCYPEFGMDVARGKMRFGLTHRDMQAIQGIPPQNNERVFIRFGSNAIKAWKNRVVSEWRVSAFYDDKENLPPVDDDNDTGLEAVIELEKVQGCIPEPFYYKVQNIREKYGRMPRLLEKLHPEDREELRQRGDI